jgi:hypothetical protein
MKSIITPIKRSVQLVPLSQEHHEGLLFAWKINQGIKNGVSNDIIVSYCNWFWENHLQDHFNKEEKAFTWILGTDQPLIVKMLDDHEAIRAKLTELNEAPSEAGLERLAQIITYHTRFEERELYNYIQEVATEEQLNLIAEAVAEKNERVDEWKYAFWKNSLTFEV